MVIGMQLGGIHHLTAVTANVGQNHAFYTQVMGMRLVKKTVNQDVSLKIVKFYPYSPIQIKFVQR